MTVVFWFWDLILFYIDAAVVSFVFIYSEHLVLWIRPQPSVSDFTFQIIVFFIKWTQTSINVHFNYQLQCFIKEKYEPKVQRSSVNYQKYLVKAPLEIFSNILDIMFLHQYTINIQYPVVSPSIYSKKVQISLSVMFCEPWS